MSWTLSRERTRARNLNTMGIDDRVPYEKTMDLDPAEEIARMGRYAAHRGMKLLPKDTFKIGNNDIEVTWYNGSKSYDPSNLDHVVASDHVDIRSMGGNAGPVTVLGWPALKKSEWKKWFSTYSDHAMLYFEVWG